MKNLVGACLQALLGVCLAATVTRTASGAVITGPITNSANGHLYYLLSPTNWPSAEAEAVQMGGHLVTINDAAENTWVLNTFGDLGGSFYALLIGLTDQGHEGVWIWTSSEPAAYRNWAPGEPNNGAGVFPYENYSVMYVNGAPFAPGTWNDVIGTDPSQILPGLVEVAEKLSVRVSQVELCWPSRPGITYQLQFRPVLPGSDWSNLGDPIVGTGSNICLTDSVSATGARFYRLTTVP